MTCDNPFLPFGCLAVLSSLIAAVAAWQRWTPLLLGDALCRARRTNRGTNDVYPHSGAVPWVLPGLTSGESWRQVDYFRSGGGRSSAIVLIHSQRLCS